MDIFCELHGADWDHIDAYNCYASILIYSSNYKTVFVTTMYLAVAIATSPLIEMHQDADGEHDDYEAYGSEFKEDIAKWKHRGLVAVTILCAVPYIYLIVTHCFSMILLPMFAACLYGILYCSMFGMFQCCLDANSRVCDRVLCLVMSLSSAFVAFYFISFVMPFVMCHVWSGESVAQSVKLAFEERSTNADFHHLILNIKNAWRFVTYLF